MHIMQFAPGMNFFRAFMLMHWEKDDHASGITDPYITIHSLSVSYSIKRSFVNCRNLSMFFAGGIEEKMRMLINHSLTKRTSANTRCVALCLIICAG